MAAARHFTDQEVAAWLKSRPKKVMSAKVVISNTRKELLVVKPNYKPGWFFVGGVVEAHESPLQAVLREAKEEVNLTLQPQQLRFVGIRYGVSKRCEDDYLHIIFCTTLTDELEKQIRLNDPELEGLKWVLSNEQTSLAEQIYPAWQYAGRTQQALYAEQDGTFISAF